MSAVRVHDAQKNLNRSNALTSFSSGINVVKEVMVRITLTLQMKPAGNKHMKGVPAKYPER